MYTIRNKDAFIYLWFDTKNRMFYLGSHKGTPDDAYTHSSTVMESFTKTSIPSYMRRRILAMGTHEEMIELETKLLGNRKEKCWDKYYNVTVAFPPPPMYGENNPKWKGGVSLDPEYQREQNRKHYAKNAERIREKKREYSREYRVKNPEKVLEQKREYNAKNAENIREKNRKHYAKNPEKVLEQQREYYAKNAERIREKKREQQREYRAKKKAEKINSVDLSQFMG